MPTVSMPTVSTETQRVQFKRLPRVHDETLGYEVSLPNKRLTAERLHKLSELGFCWSAKQVRKTGSTGNLVSSGSVTAPTPVTTHTPSPMSTCTAITVPLSVSLLPATTCTFASTYPALDSSRGNGNQTRMNADAQWKDYYTRLALFKERYGHVLVPRKYEEDPKLAAWVETQRALWNRDFNQSKDKRNTALSAAYTNTDQSWATTNKAALSQHAALLPTTRRLTLERKEQLDALGFVWSLRSKRIDDHWHEMFNQLVDYKNQHGDCLVPSRYEANLKLGKVSYYPCLSLRTLSPSHSIVSYHVV